MRPRDTVTVLNISGVWRSGRTAIIPATRLDTRAGRKLLEVDPVDGQGALGIG